jgi:IS30 family transposase
LIEVLLSVTLSFELTRLRAEFGHWEGDTVEGKGHREGIHTEVERKSRLLMAAKVGQISSDVTIEAQKAMFEALPKEARRSTTLDNGHENHRHNQLAGLGMDTYFADPYSSRQ